MNNEIIYLVLTDVYNSCNIDSQNGDPINWRKISFKKQLTELLVPEKSLALKSIGDSLFIIYEINDNNERQTISGIFKNVWEAFKSVQDQKDNIKHKIRVVLHRVELNDNNRRGNDFGDIFNGFDEKKISILKISLLKDIFGQEINRAARILSFFNEPTVILTQDIVEKWLKSDEKITLVDPSKKIDSNNLYICSPTPICYFKGIDEVTIQKPYYLYELKDSDNEESLSVLRKELKDTHMMYLLISETKRNLTPQECTNLNSIIKREIGFGNPGNIHRLHTDFLFEVIDYYIIQDPSFSRKKKYQDNTDYGKFISKKITYLVIIGQKSKLDISRNNNEINAVITENNIEEIYLTNYIIISSLPSNSKYKRLIRDSYELKSINNISTQTKPQSIEIFNKLLFNKTWINNLITFDVNNTTAKIEEEFILVLFQIYFQDMDIVGNSESLFATINNDEENEIKLYGLTTGVTDGFLFIKINDKFEKSIKDFFVNLKRGKDRSNDLYNKIYPIAIFHVKSSLDPLKSNLRIINQK